MNEIIFVKPKHEYTSYTDLWTLVNLAGYPVIEPDAMKPFSAHTYIIPCINGEFSADGWKGTAKKPLKAKIIRWMLEWGVEEKRNGIAEYWCPDAWNAAANDARYVPLGGDRRLAGERFPPVPTKYATLEWAFMKDERAATREIWRRAGYDIDIAFPAYLTNRRMHVRDRLIERGVKFNNVPDDLPAAATSWGAERNAAYNAARLALSIHQDKDKPALPPLRLVVAAAYHLPFLTEEVPDQGVFRGKILTEPYEQLVERVPYWLSQDLTGYADELARYLNTELTFKASIEDNL